MRSQRRLQMYSLLLLQYDNMIVYMYIYIFDIYIFLQYSHVSFEACAFMCYVNKQTWHVFTIYIYTLIFTVSQYHVL